MATILPDSPTDELHEASTPHLVPGRPPHEPMNRSHRWGRRLLWIVGTLAILTGAVTAARAFFDGGDDIDRTTLTHTVARNNLLVTVTEDGNLESASNLDIKCQVAGGSSILWIIEDGATVKKGDKLVELDSAALEEQINQQRIVFEKARSTKIQAEKNFEVAKLSVREYLEGTFKKELQDADAAIRIAEENLRSAQNSLEHAERMFRKGYVSSLELEGQRFAVERANLELASANTAREVLLNFTKEKTLQDLQSQRDTAEAQMKSETAAYELEELRLKRLEEQLVNCVIFAPQDGMVVYANDRSSRYRQEQSGIEEGAAIREQQTILRLPDLSRMQVKVTVHESKVDQLAIGMPARIRVLDRNMRGTVTSIANQPEPTSWFSANVKEYATIVRIDQAPENLRPGQTAEVEIEVANLRDIITLPVAAIIEQRGGFCCWVRTPEGAERRPLVLGLSNDEFVEVKDGVSEGDVVILNPRSVVPEARLTEDTSEEDPSDRADEATVDAPAVQRNQPARRGAGQPEAGPADASAGPDGSQPENGAGHADAGAGRPGGDRAGQRRGGNLMRLDQDKDGRISRDEAPERMRPMFDRLDANSDGFLDATEMKAMRRRPPPANP